MLMSTYLLTDVLMMVSKSTTKLGTASGSAIRGCCCCCCDDDDDDCCCCSGCCCGRVETEDAEGEAGAARGWARAGTACGISVTAAMSSSLDVAASRLGGLVVSEEGQEIEGVDSQRHDEINICSGQ